MFSLSRNERSRWSGNGVHVEPELVFMIGRNMHVELPRLTVQEGSTYEYPSFLDGLPSGS